MKNWQYKSFQDLSTKELYDILKLRQEVFVIEQQCIYPDIDEIDKTAFHLFAYSDDGEELCAYLRVLAPGIKFTEISIGRVLTSKSSRGTGAGKALMDEAIRVIEREFPHQPIKISAQKYLVRFYRQFKFVEVSEVYDEDGIQHVDMLRRRI